MAKCAHCGKTTSFLDATVPGQIRAPGGLPPPNLQSVTVYEDGVKCFVQSVCGRWFNELSNEQPIVFVTVLAVTFLF